MRIRAVRVLEYEGDEAWVLETLEKSHVQGVFLAGKGTIRSTVSTPYSIEVNPPKEGTTPC